MRRRSPRRSVTPCRSRNSRIWMATLRPLSRRSRNAAAANCPSGALAARSTAISVISATVLRRKKWSWGTSSNFAETAKQLAEPAYLGLGAADHAAHVTNPRRARAFVAGKQRSYRSPQSFLVGGQTRLVTRQPNPGPSSATSLTFANVCRAAVNTGTGKRSSSCRRSGSNPMPGRSGFWA